MKETTVLRLYIKLSRHFSLAKFLNTPLKYYFLTTHVIRLHDVMSINKKKKKQTIFLSRFQI